MRKDSLLHQLLFLSSLLECFVLEFVCTMKTITTSGISSSADFSAFLYSAKSIFQTLCHIKHENFTCVYNKISYLGVPANIVGLRMEISINKLSIFPEKKPILPPPIIVTKSCFLCMVCAVYQLTKVNCVVV
jgi:hypothetical protein